MGLAAGSASRQPRWASWNADFRQHVRPADIELRVILGDLLDKPLVAVLATLRTDGTVLLSPGYHEWRDGGFNIWVEQQTAIMAGAN